MSSTNRKNAKERHVSDYYVTPVSVIDDFLKQYIKDTGYSFSDKRVLDPCAGGDENNTMSYPTALAKYVDYVKTIDIREDSLAEIKDNFLTIEQRLLREPDVIITNPPFNIALDIIKKSLDVVPVGGKVIMLLRLNFFGSQSRKEFWESNSLRSFKENRISI
jgi:hypothetical protein